MTWEWFIVLKIVMFIFLDWHSLCLLNILSFCNFFQQCVQLFFSFHLIILYQFFFSVDQFEILFFLFWSLNNEWLNSLTWYFLNGVFYHQQNGDYTRRILVPTVASAPPSVGRQVVMHPGVKRFDPPLLILCKLWLIECWHFLTKK